MFGHQYTQELLQGNNLQCTELIRMSRDSFVRICNNFKETNWLRDSKHISVEEMMFIFLMIIGHNERFYVMKRRELFGALDGTLIHAYVPSHKQNVYKAKGIGRCGSQTQNVTRKMCLDNKVLREVNKEDSAAGVWLKLETLYMTKSLANKLYLKNKLFTFYMHSETLLYGRETLTLEDILSSLNSWDLKKRTDAKDDGDGLYDHLKKDCLKGNKKKSTGFVKKNVGQGSGMLSEGYDNGDLLMAFDFKEFNGGTVFLGDNRACAIKGTGKVRVQMKDNSCFVLKNGRTMKENYVYSLDGWAESGEASVGIQENKSLAQVWHKCLGHITEAGLHELERRDVPGNKGLEGVIDYVHANLWGPSRVESMSGCRYFLSIVNYYSRRFGFIFLDTRMRRSANSRSERSCGIARHLIVAGTPQQNGLAERVNMTLLNKVRSPSTALEKNTPMDLWSGHPVNYEMLRIFGCVAYSHVNQRKLKPRAIKCIFLGLMYKDTLKGDNAVNSRKEVEFEMELQGSRVKPTMDSHTEENSRNKDKEQDEGPQQQNLDNYVLVCDRAKRTSVVPARYKDEGRDEFFKEESYLGAGRSITWFEADYELEQLDVKTTFLHGYLKETIYMRQPPDFKEGTGNKVCLLKKSLYGLKQSLRQWYKRFDVYMMSNGFSRSSYDSYVYFKEFAPGMYIIYCCM
ncbi:retrovirus-related pol polyprotein from transposon TNT 1-94 [Tanacetum coccineum]